MSRLRITSVLLTAISCFAVERAAAIGYWSLPGNCAQYAGHGFGAGHHAPIVRAPARRTPYVPRVTFDGSYRYAGPYGQCFDCVTSYAAPACAGGNCYGQSIPPHSHTIHSSHSSANQVFSAPAAEPTPALPNQRMPQSTPKVPSTRSTNGEELPSPAMPSTDPATGNNYQAWRH